MISLLRLLFEDPEVLITFLPRLPYLIVLIFTAYITVYVNKKHNGKEASLIVSGATLEIISFVVSVLFSTIILPQMNNIDYSNITYYYGVINIVGSLGNILFLYGSYLLFKKYLENKPLKDTIPENDNDFFIQKN